MPWCNQVALYSGVSCCAAPSSTRSVGCKVEMLTNFVASARQEGSHCLSLVLMLHFIAHASAHSFLRNGRDDFSTRGATSLWRRGQLSATRVFGLLRGDDLPPCVTVAVNANIHILSLGHFVAACCSHGLPHVMVATGRALQHMLSSCAVQA